MNKIISQNGSFGKANRSGTPVKGIISGDYGATAERDITQRYEE